MAKRNTKVKAPAIRGPIPRNRDEADQLIFQLGVAMREHAWCETAMNEDLAKLKAEYETQAAPIAVTIAVLTEGIQTWAEAHRSELLAGDSKTVKLGNGEIAWRARPASVSLRGVDKIIAWCRSHRLSKFLRMKTEVSKEAMLADTAKAAKIPGVKIESTGEDFIVTPFNAELEEAV